MNNMYYCVMCGLWELYNRLSVFADVAV